MKYIMMVLGVCVTFAFVAHAQTVVSTPVSVVSAPAPATPEATSFLKAIDEKIPSSIPLSVLSLIGLLIELAMRAIPSAQPRSLFLLASEVLKILADMFTKVSGLLDSIVQTLTPPKA